MTSNIDQLNLLEFYQACQNYNLTGSSHVYPPATHTQTDKRNVAQAVADELAEQAGEGWVGKVCWNADVAGVWEITLIKETVRMMSGYPYAEQECRIAWVDLGF